MSLSLRIPELKVNTSGVLQVDIVSGGPGGSSDTQYTTGVDTYIEGTTIVTMAGAVRNDTLATLANSDNQLAPLQVNASGALYVDSSNSTQPVSASSLPLPSGASTAAKQPALGTAGTASADVISVQGIASMTALKVDGSAITQPISGTITANLSATDNAVLDNIETNTDVLTVVGGGLEATALRVTLASDSTGVITVDNGGTFAVQVSSSLPAGTNAIGKLSANSGVNIGDVGIIPGTSSTSIGKAVDDVAGGTDTGVALLAVRDDVLTGLDPADGDYTHLRVSSTGALHVTGGGGGVQYAEDSVHASGDTGTMTLAVRNDTLAALAGTDGDYAPLQVNADGALYVTSGSVLSAGNTTTTPLGISATFTGTGELNEFADVMVSCITNVTGTLYFDFSVDNVNWGAFPSAGFGLSAGIHEFHTAVKGPRYFRVRLANDATDQSYLRLYTYYGVFRLGNAPLNQSIGADSDAVIVRSVQVGVDPTGNYQNVPVDGFAFSTTDNLGAGETYMSAVFDIAEYTQVQTMITSSHDGTLLFEFASDSLLVDVVRTLSIPYVTASGFQLLSAPAFSQYVRYKFTNNGGSTTTDLFYATKFLMQALSAQVLTLNTPIAGGMTAHLGRNIIAGQNSSGAFANIGITDAAELFVNTLASNRAKTVTLTATVGATTGQWFMLVDLSDTTTFKHAQTTGIVVDHVTVSAAVGISSTGTLHIGVCTEVDGTDGSATFFYRTNWVGETGGGAAISAYDWNMNFAPNGVNMTVTGGTATHHVGNSGVTADAALQTGLTLTSVSGTPTAPAAGDLLCRVVNGDANGVTVSVTVGYHSV